MGNSRQAKNRSNPQFPAKSARSMFAPRPFAAEADTTEANLSDPNQVADAQPNVQARSPLPPVNFLTMPTYAPTATPPVQAKLTVGEPGDKYEQEADRVAAEVVNQMSAPQPTPIQREDNLEEEEIQTKPLTESIAPSVQREDNLEEEEIQTKPLADSIAPLVQREEKREEDLQMMPVQRVTETGGMEASPDLESSIAQARGGGRPLAQSIRAPIEQAMGADFSGVKVHTNAQADQLNRSVQAKAFTTGQDVFFRQGEYNPGSRGGQELLAHELTHVVQQSGGAVQQSDLKPSLIKAQHYGHNINQVVSKQSEQEPKSTETNQQSEQMSQPVRKGVRASGILPGSYIFSTKGSVWNRFVPHKRKNLSHKRKNTDQTAPKKAQQGGLPNPPTDQTAPEETQPVTSQDTEMSLTETQQSSSQNSEAVMSGALQGGLPNTPEALTEIQQVDSSNTPEATAETQSSDSESEEADTTEIQSSDSQNVLSPEQQTYYNNEIMGDTQWRNDDQALFGLLEDFLHEFHLHSEGYTLAVSRTLGDSRGQTHPPDAIPKAYRKEVENGESLILINAQLIRADLEDAEVGFPRAVSTLRHEIQHVLNNQNEMGGGEQGSALAAYDEVYGHTEAILNLVGEGRAPEIARETAIRNYVQALAYSLQLEGSEYEQDAQDRLAFSMDKMQDRWEITDQEIEEAELA